MKKKRVYFVRHGQSIWNTQKKVCGVTDVELTTLGHEQAVQAGKDIAESGIVFDEIISSPLIRAVQTARHISEITGRPVKLDERLTEHNFGKFEGTDWDRPEFRQSKECFADSYEGGESLLRLAQRIYNLLDEIKADTSGKTYLLVAHNGVARAVESYFHSMTNQEYASFGVKNCAVVTYEWDDQSIGGYHELQNN